MSPIPVNKSTAERHTVSLIFGSHIQREHSTIKIEFKKEKRRCKRPQKGNYTDRSYPSILGSSCGKNLQAALRVKFWAEQERGGGALGEGGEQIHRGKKKKPHKIT